MRDTVPRTQQFFCNSSSFTLIDTLHTNFIVMLTVVWFQLLFCMRYKVTSVIALLEVVIFKTVDYIDFRVIVKLFKMSCMIINFFFCIKAKISHCPFFLVAIFLISIWLSKTSPLLLLSCVISLRTWIIMIIYRAFIYHIHFLYNILYFLATKRQTRRSSHLASGRPRNWGMSGERDK